MNQPHIPAQETRNRLLRNLRQTRLEVAQFNLELDEIIALLDQQTRKQKLERLKQSQIFNQNRAV